MAQFLDTDLSVSLRAMESILQHSFAQPELLVQALTHSSFSNENGLGASPQTDNERFEFLGDAVIGLVIANLLMELFPDACEGKLSRWRSNLVSRKTLAEIAIELRLGDYVLLGRGERRTGGAEKRSILAAALEAIVGAVYLDGGLEPAARFLRSIYMTSLELLREGKVVHAMLDRKTHLQERTQSIYKVAPIYRLVESWGPEHEKFFKVEILIEGKVVASGEGRSKKEAEQNAAHIALEAMGI